MQGVTLANRVLRPGNRRVDFKSPGDRDCLGIMTGAEEEGDRVLHSVESDLEVSAF